MLSRKVFSCTRESPVPGQSPWVCRVSWVSAPHKHLNTKSFPTAEIHECSRFWVNLFCVTGAKPLISLPFPALPVPKYCVTGNLHQAMLSGCCPDEGQELSPCPRAVPGWQAVSAAPKDLFLLSLPCPSPLQTEEHLRALLPEDTRSQH